MPYNNSMALIAWRKYFDKEMLEDGKLLEKKGRIWLEIRFPISVHLSSFCLSYIYPEFIWGNIIDSFSRFGVHYLLLTGGYLTKVDTKKNTKKILRLLGGVNDCSHTGIRRIDSRVL